MTVAALYTVDWALRGATIGLLLLIAAVLVRDYRHSIAARLTIGLAIGTSAYTICSGPDAHELLGGCLQPLLALTAGNNVVFWLFASAVFDDSFRLRRWHGALWLVMVALGAVECVADNRWLSIALICSSFVFAALAVVPTIATWKDDLLEGRRRIRGYIVVASAAYTAISAFANLTGNVHPAAGAPNLLAALALVAIVGPAAWSTLGFRTSQRLFASLGQPTLVPTALPVADEPASPAPAEAVSPVQVAALERAMTVDRTYRKDGLTIAQLADQLGMPEYRLRRLINQALGYRNFNSFLNFYRIADAKAALADPAQATVPVLTIALDSGFSSLGPFNRAFKAETGVTPSEFRRLNGANPEKDRPIPDSASAFSNSASRISPAP
jgi:AraC-like DNA-binding protein